MEPTAALQLLLNAHRLKCIPRTGWAMRGVADAESVADHSFGVAFTSLILTELMEQPIDKVKLLTIALLHDLPESIIGDIPSPATTHLPPSSKQNAEAQVLGRLLSQLPSADQWRAWWQEFEEGTSIEGHLVRDADRLDMLIQAYVYEQTTGNRWLGEFWPSPGILPFESAAAYALYQALIALREHST